MNAFLTGNELKEALTILPQYDDRIRNATTGERLLALNNLFNLYYPSPMAAEIYSKLYLAYVRAMQKKHTLAAVRQGYENRKAAKGQHYQGIIGGSDSFTIVGVSGIGKSSAISRAISLITKDQFTQPESPEIISFLTVQTPGDSSLKGLLLEILRSIDAILNTKYYADAIRSRATVDMLIGLVSQVCLNHLCVLIVDEAQNLVAAKNGKTLVNTLVQLINNSGISLCFVGTPECTAFFESAYQLARRSIGLSYSALAYDDYFRSLCQVLFSYQYTAKRSAITEDIISWLYLYTGGVTAVLVGLIYNAQEIAILDGSEVLSLETLIRAYKRRMAMLHGYLREDRTSVTSYPGALNEPLRVETTEELQTTTLPEVIAAVKHTGADIICTLKNHFAIEEIVL